MSLSSTNTEIWVIHFLQMGFSNVYQVVILDKFNNSSNLLLKLQSPWRACPLLSEQTLPCLSTQVLNMFIGTAKLTGFYLYRNLNTCWYRNKFVHHPLLTQKHKICQLKPSTSEGLHGWEKITVRILNWHMREWQEQSYILVVIDVHTTLTYKGDKYII